MADACHYRNCDHIEEVIRAKTNPTPKADTRAATFSDLRKVERLRALRDNPAATKGEKRAAC